MNSSQKELLNNISRDIITSSNKDSSSVDRIYSFISYNTFEALSDFFSTSVVLYDNEQFYLPIVADNKQLANYIVQSDPTQALLATLVNKKLVPYLPNFVPLLGYNTAGPHYDIDHKIIIAPHSIGNDSYYYLLYPSIGSFNIVNLPLPAFISILYQLLFTLEIAQHLANFRHNNLTMESIHIKQLKEAVVLQYIRPNGSTIKFSTSYILQIDNVSNSYIVDDDTIYGTKLSHPYEDLYTVMHAIYTADKIKSSQKDVIKTLMLFNGPISTPPPYDTLTPIINYMLKEYPLTVTIENSITNNELYDKLYSLTNFITLFSMPFDQLTNNYMTQLTTYMEQLPPFTQLDNLEDILFYSNVFYILWYRSHTMTLSPYLSQYYNTRDTFVAYVQTFILELEPDRLQYYIDILNYCKLI